MKAWAKSHSKEHLLFTWIVFNSTQNRLHSTAKRVENAPTVQQNRLGTWARKSCELWTFHAAVPNRSHVISV